MTGRSRGVWSDFWQRSGSGSGSEVPQPLRRIDEIQAALWQSFAQDLPASARVLDLGTGDAVVLRRMIAIRSDIVAIGTDSAPILPEVPGITIRTATPMESLPFAAGTFDAATSQFAFEYGDTLATAAQLGRVLRPGGRLRMLLHHVEGRFVAHNQPRLEPLLWALGTSGCLTRARALARARGSASIPTPDHFREIVENARRLFPDQSVAENFTQAVLQTVELGQGARPEEVLQVLDDLQAKAENEVGRIRSLTVAACDAPRIKQICEELATAGMVCARPVEIWEESAHGPFAWMVEGLRR